MKAPELRTIATIFACIFSLSANARQTDTVTVQFEFNRSEITTGAAARLDSILQIIGARKLQQIKLYGHCDFIGSNRYNDSLSQARILSVKEYLGGKGIASAIFKRETAYGKRRPLAEGNSDEARAINRRVELIIESAAEPVAGKPSLSETMKDTSLKIGINLVLENLNFVGGRHQLLQESLPILDELLRALQENPTVAIEIQGYVCCTENNLDGYDWDLGTNDLSVQRAKAIYNFLIEKGINADRLSYRGYGGSRKLFPDEEDEYQRSRNRRVELKIISK